MKEVSVQELQLNPMTKIAKEWMLITAGNEQDGYNAMTASWGHLGAMWGQGGGLPTAVAYLRPQRYTKEFVDRADTYTISFFCDENQALILAQIEQEGEFHVAFVAHGEDANEYIPAAQRVLSGESSGNTSEDMTDNTGIDANQNTGSNLEGSIGE